MKRILISAGGKGGKEVPAFSWDRIIGVDSGGNFLLKKRMPAHEIVGDLDSISRRALAFHVTQGALVRKFNEDKDQTDLELTMEGLSDDPGAEVFFHGLFGGRFDHALMNLLLLKKYTRKGCLTFDFKGGTGGIIGPGNISLKVASGALVGLIALSPVVQGIVSEGVKWPLKNDSLRFGESRGVSNVLTRSQWRLSHRKGVLVWLVNGYSREAVGIEWHPSDP